MLQQVFFEAALSGFFSTISCLELLWFVVGFCCTAVLPCVARYLCVCLIALHCAALHCTPLHRLRCPAVHHFYCTTLCHVVLHRSMLCCTALRCCGVVLEPWAFWCRMNWDPVQLWPQLNFERWLKSGAAHVFEVPGSTTRVVWYGYEACGDVGVGVFGSYKCWRLLQGLLVAWGGSVSFASSSCCDTLCWAGLCCVALCCAVLCALRCAVRCVAVRCGEVQCTTRHNTTQHNTT